MLLVTGGSGFIGTNFILKWLEKNSEPIVNIDLLTYAGCKDNIRENNLYKFVHGDIGNEDLIKELLITYKPRAIINFAAETHVDRSIQNPNQFIYTNVLATHNLLKQTRDYWKSYCHDKGAFRFIHVSTDEVYGSLEPDESSFTESSLYRPNSPYSASKASSDHFVRAYYQTYGMPTIITNCSNNYGPYQFPEKLIPMTIASCLTGRIIPVYGDGKQVRDWLYVEDHCTALEMILNHGTVGQSYNIGGSNEEYNIDVVKSICRYLDLLKPLQYPHRYESLIKHVSDRPGHDRRYAINSEKIKKELGWKPKISFSVGLKKTVEWCVLNECFLKNRS